MIEAISPDFKNTNQQLGRLKSHALKTALQVGKTANALGNDYASAFYYKPDETIAWTQQEMLKQITRPIEFITAQATGSHGKEHPKVQKNVRRAAKFAQRVLNLKIIDRNIARYVNVSRREKNKSSLAEDDAGHKGVMMEDGIRETELNVTAEQAVDISKLKELPTLRDAIELSIPSFFLVNALPLTTKAIEILYNAGKLDNRNHAVLIPFLADMGMKTMGGVLGGLPGYAVATGVGNLMATDPIVDKLLKRLVTKTVKKT
jgi:hypothetical protein